jgi:membrane fusion protein (multidrug efflux system)
LAIGVVLLLVAWIVWFIRSRVSVFAVSDSARIELASSAPPVTSPVKGRVVGVDLRIGQSVEAGQVLVRLDDSVETHQLGITQARLAALEQQLRSAGPEYRAEEEKLRMQTESAKSAVMEARQRLAAAAARAASSRRDFESIRRLQAAGLVAPLELSRVEEAAIAEEATTSAQRATLQGAEWALRGVQGERIRRENEMQRQLAELSGSVDAAREEVAALEAQVQRLRLRAPVAGIIGDAAALSQGSFVDEGAVVAVVVPPGGMRVVGYFLPATVLGRVRPGNTAQLRLDGFSWSEFGTIPAFVTSVGAEVRDGHVRVEMSLRDPLHTQIPLQHGVPGTAEIEIERLSPARLLLRTAGRLVDKPVAASRQGPP